MSRLVRIPDLLRAAAVIDRRTPTEIAVMTGIKASRVARLLTGRTFPSGDEPERILAACAQDPRLVSTPCLTGRGALPPGTVFELLLAGQLAAPDDLGPHPCVLCVDKLSLSFDTRPDELLVIAGVGRIVKTDRSVYEHNYRIGGLFMQFSPRRSTRGKRRNSRIEFNPARTDDLTWKLVRRVLTLATRVRVTRIDVAADLPMSLGQLQAIPHDRAKLFSVIGPGGIETIYVGARKSRRSIVLYDKRQERIDRGHADESQLDELRVEARHRSLGIGLAELPDLPDPFAKLAFVTIAADLPFPLALCAAWARVYGVQALRSLVSSGEFAAVAKPVSPSDVTHPSSVFADQWPAVARELLRKLGIARTSTERTNRRGTS